MQHDTAFLDALKEDIAQDRIPEITPGHPDRPPAFGTLAVATLLLQARAEMAAKGTSGPYP